MSWYKKLFIEEPTLKFKDELYDVLKKKHDVFFENYEPLLCQENEIQLNQWYNSNEGQNELLRLVQDFWNLLNINALNAMPAHDARHAIYKVPTFSLKYMEAENVIGYERLGLIGALAHDFGRWSEEKLFGNANPSAIHARMSFVLLEEFLQNYNIPNILKAEILAAVIRHTTGCTAQDGMIIKLVVSPDRDQLIGPEIVLRLSHHKPTEKALHSFMGETNEESILDRIVKYYFIRLPGPLYSLPVVDELYKLTHTFCLLVLGEDRWSKYVDK
jgi:hypothetical protein